MLFLDACVFRKSMVSEIKGIFKLKKKQNKRKAKTRGETPQKRGPCVPAVVQMKYSRLHSVAVFCKSISFLKELSKFSGYSFFI